MYEYNKLSSQERTELVQQRRQLGFPLHSPPHPFHYAQYYLITATCYRHQSYINSTTRRQQLLDLWMEASPSNHIEIQAWAILPNHYHLLVDTEDLKHVGSVVRSIHGTTSYRWNREDKMKGRKIWYCYSDRAIRSQRHYYTTLNYIHYNPVKHGWVQSPYDWSASSVEWYRQSRGRNWLRELWVNYPVRDYGRGWDDL